MNTPTFAAWTCCALLALAAALPACVQSSHVRPGTAGDTGSAVPAPTIVGNEWRCTRLGASAPPADCMPTLTLAADGTASGFAGVNRWSGTCTSNGPTLAFGPLVSTRMGGPPERMELERKYLQSMATVTQWSIADGTLRLSDGSTVVAEFEPVPAPAAGTKH